MAVTEVTLRTDLGEVDVRLVADRSRHTLGDVVEAVLGRRATGAVEVDGRARPIDTRLADAGLRRGSTVDVSASVASAAATSVALVELEQVAGHGSGAVARLGAGHHRIGPTRRVNARHLAPGLVDESVVIVEVSDGDVTVEPGGSLTVWIDGARIDSPTPWTGGLLVAGDRVLRRRTTTRPDDDAVLAERARVGAGGRLVLGRRLDDDGRAAELSVDAAAGVGVVADPDDALALLRALVVDLAARPSALDAIVVLTDRPRSWEWTKWLPQTGSIVLVEPGEFTDDGLAHLDDDTRTTDGRSLIVVDRTSPDALPAAPPAGAIVVAAAPGKHQLPVLLDTIVEPVDDGAAAVRVTTTVAGRTLTYGRVAPNTLDHDTAARLARRLAERGGTTPDESTTDDRAAELDADDELLVEPWIVTREPSPLERRILRHATLERSSTPENDSDASPDEPWVETDSRTDLERLLDRSIVDESRIVLPLGWWTERDGIATIQLTQGRHLLITAKPRCGRSTLMSLMAEGARHADPDLRLFALAPRRGALVDGDRAARLGVDLAASPDDVKDWVERIQQAVRPMVFIDDADRVGGPSLDRLAGEGFGHVTAIMAARPGVGSNHWSSRWHSALLTIRLDATGDGALVTRHRSRAFRTISPDESDS